jgi:hypothetical protein
LPAASDTRSLSALASEIDDDLTHDQSMADEKLFELVAALERTIHEVRGSAEI